MEKNSVISSIQVSSLGTKWSSGEHGSLVIQCEIEDYMR